MRSFESCLKIPTQTVVPDSVFWDGSPFTLEWRASFIDSFLLCFVNPLIAVLMIVIGPFKGEHRGTRT